MQRSSSSSVRTVMALCLVTLVVVTVLYLAKRVEVNNTLRELELVKVSCEGREEGAYLAKRMGVGDLWREGGGRPSKESGCRDT